MSHWLLLLLVGLIYTLIFRLLGFLRREKFSLRFILEAMGMTLLVVALSLLGFRLNPILFLLLLYLVTMRTRVLVDIANMAARRRVSLAEQFYRLARRLWPDESGRLIIGMNEGAILTLAGRVSEAIPIMEKVLETEGLPPKYAAATHYNLGVAYHKAGEDGQLIIGHLNAAIEAMPNSVYARSAQKLLRERLQGPKSSTG